MKKYFQKLIFFIFFVPIYFFSLENLNTHPLSDDFADLVEKLSPSVVNVFKRHYKKIIEQHYSVNKQSNLINKFF